MGKKKKKKLKKEALWLDQGTLVKGYKLQFLSFVIQRHCGIKSVFSSNIERGKFLSSEEKATRFAPKDETQSSEFQSHHFILLDLRWEEPGTDVTSNAVSSTDELAHYALPKGYLFLM